MLNLNSDSDIHRILELQWNLSNPTHQGTKEMYRIVYSEYSGFILANRNTLGPTIFVRCHNMSANSGVILHKIPLHIQCIKSQTLRNIKIDIFVLISSNIPDTVKPACP